MKFYALKERMNGNSYVPLLWLISILQFTKHVHICIPHSGLQGDQTSQSWRKSVLNIHWKDWCCAPILWPPDAKNWLIRKDPDAGKDWRQEEKGMTDNKMVGWHHWLDGLETEQALGVGDGQGSLGCCSPWGHKESDTTKRLDWTDSGI